ncbi:YtxH domain-containing protein [Echinicola jeungdonensis]|uniref:YtxH domain-containing protein n=1 Tax=Echinicola jeungdonensis TaxID=709343 RepID=A0ABV5JAS6_9BACT|nr:YtxH domain-containing protein [Echinicola jeungdonensis]MDN3670534.1 YtxH domain-containing protein [Echinicola jeungdonensis]
MDMGKILLGTLAGIVTGVAFGVMMAPDRGSKTRKKVYKQGEDLAKMLNEQLDVKFNEWKSSVNELIKKKVEQIENLEPKDKSELAN